MNNSERLKEIIKEIGIPLRRLPEILEISSENSLNWWMGELKIDIKEPHFNRLSMLLALNEQSLVDGSYSRKLARERIFGNLDTLPNKYIDNPNSFLRTSEHIYKYIVLTRGQLFANQVLSQIDVSPLIYEKTDRLVNLTYFADLLDVLSKYGLSNNELDTLASVIFLSLKNRPLGHQIGKSENLHQVYSTLADNFGYFDSNFEYNSSFIGKKYILTTTLPLEFHNELLQDRGKVKRLMRYRTILLAWFPYLAGMTPLFPSTEVISDSSILRVRYELKLY